MKLNLKSMTLGLVMIAIPLTSFQSCIGSFSLTNKVLTWNKQVSNKFVNELVFFAFWILPVYEVTAMADLLVINSIEFWSGNNPLEASVKIIETESGDYLIANNETGYTITDPNGEIISFIFDNDSKTWSLITSNGQSQEFLRFIDDNNVQIPGIDGDFVDIELSREGVDAYILSTTSSLMALR